MPIYCPVCQKKVSLYFRARDLNCGISDKIFNYYRCSECGLIFLSPIPNNLGKYYTSSYLPYQIPSLQDLRKNAERERFKLDIIQNFAKKGKLLEIGPSYGAFAYLAKEAGFEVEAIEMDIRCCDFLKNVIGVKVINNIDVGNALQEAGDYDVITLWHVLEHLTDPWKTLDSIAKKLRSGGILVFAMPNPSSLEFRIFGRFWEHIEAPRHLSFIPMKLLVKYIEKLGLKPISVTTRDKAGAVFMTADWWRSSFRNLQKGIFPFLKIRKTNKFTNSSTTRKCFLPIELLFYVFCLIYFIILKPIEFMEGLGPAYTAIFRKD